MTAPMTAGRGVNATPHANAKDTHDGLLSGRGVPAPALHLTPLAWRLIAVLTCTAGALLLLAAGHLGQTNRCHHLQPGTTAFHTYCAPEAHR